ncbi:hypothetical protein GCM10010172_62230 [Paractinoplanes ferrugineus]|uniref:PilZ domain-containing protein n=1 Tax=Paractinoplanes ferrugineus TaxID=113564 RepID=A0A919J8R4_9ACTN|nr:PilZ domain-containing protein [Actinoplanes ferrugineus]GIE16615.1 hypothetical protein Afe05nite_84550 [Actinoplanes ferrugineus]
MTTTYQEPVPLGGDVVQEEPMPWNADKVYVSFRGGPAYTSQVSRHTDDLARIGRSALRVPVGTPVQMQWTQNRRGSFAEAVVVAVPEGEQPGLYVRIERSKAGVERRGSVRTDLRVPAEITNVSGRPLWGHTKDLSLGGARILVAVEAIAKHTSDDPLFVFGEQVSIDLILGERVARLGCLVAGSGTEPGDVRLQFLDPSGSALGLLFGFLHRPAAATADIPTSFPAA